MFSSENYKDFELWQQYDDAQDNFCVKESDPGEYVDLLLNPERYTGYKGPSAHRIWRSIYLENCFRYIFVMVIKYEIDIKNNRILYMHLITGLKIPHITLFNLQK